MGSGLMFSCASAAVVGRYHSARGEQCQDAVSHLSFDDGGAIALCDGAGSCSSSLLGARDLSKWFPTWAKEHPDQLWDVPIESTSIAVSSEIFSRIRSLASKHRIYTHDLSSTFLAVVARRRAHLIEYRTFHLGDGVVASIAPDGQVILSPPSNGEYANETFFSTSPTLATSLRVSSGQLPHGSGFVLMSDGSAASLYLKSDQTLAPAVVDMLQWLKRFDPAAISAAIERNLEQVIAKKTGDDCSIAMMLEAPPA